MVACVAWRFLSNLSALRERRGRDNERQSRRSREEPNCLKTSLNRQATQANKYGSLKIFIHLLCLLCKLLLVT